MSPGILHRPPPLARREVTGCDYRRVRAEVIAGGVSHSHPGDPTGLQHQAYLRAVSRETERRLAERGYRVRAANERPPGWSVELDIAEEHAALSELAAMRRVG